MSQFIGQSLQAARTSRGWSVLHLARASEVSRHAIYRIEAGATPQLATLDRLAAALGMSTKELLPAPAQTSKDEAAPASSPSPAPVEGDPVLQPTASLKALRHEVARLEVAVRAAQAKARRAEDRVAALPGDQVCSPRGTQLLHRQIAATRDWQAALVALGEAKVRLADAEGDQR